MAPSVRSGDGTGIVIPYTIKVHIVMTGVARLVRSLVTMRWNVHP